VKQTQVLALKQQVCKLHPVNGFADNTNFVADN